MATAFTPGSALLGGILVGLAATLLYAGIGRIAGISGILNGAIERSAERGWRIAFQRRYARKLPRSRAGLAQQKPSRSIMTRSPASIMN